MMSEVITSGYIFLDDEYGFTYRIAKIDYQENENGEYRYTFMPIYSVIELLPTSLYQGIPGLDMSKKKEKYVRENMTPVFISERTPGENREDLWELLESCNMDYLNRLEWLIRTDMRYSGDPMYVDLIDETKTILEVDDISMLDSRSAGIIRRLLEVICYGGIIKTKKLVIDDSNRREFYELLMVLYIKEKKYISERKTQGIKEAAKMGKYRGRDKIKIGEPQLIEVFSAYEAGKVTGAEAADMLEISLSTYNRRYREYKKESLE